MKVKLEVSDVTIKDELQLGSFKIETELSPEEFSQYLFAVKEMVEKLVANFNPTVH